VSDPFGGAGPGLEATVARELRQPVRTDPARKAHIMELVRAESVRAESVRARAARPRRPGAWGRGRGLRGGWASPALGVALAAGFVGVVTLRGELASGGARGSAAPLGARGGAAAAVLGDTVAAAIRDTARLVRFMLVAPSASRVALAGDFNGWDARATPLVAESRGVWAAAVALAPGRHRYAFVVDDTQWVADPAAPRAGEGGRPHSVLTVPDSAN
jgi:hypothetical protein